MKLTTGILAVGLMTGGMWAQNPTVINNVQNTMNGVQQQKKADSDAALGITPQGQQKAKPMAGAPAKAADAKPATGAPARAADSKAAKPAANQPAASATAKNTAKAADKRSNAPASAQGKALAVKPAVAPAPAKSAATPAKTASTPAKTASVPVKPVATPVKGTTASVKTVAIKPSAEPQARIVIKKGTAPRTVIAAGQDTTPKPAVKKASAPTKISSEATPPVDEVKAPAAAKPEEKKWAMSGKRDPFFSPVVQAPTGSGCSSGKKCLEIGQINLRGVVKSENGFIAVVTNSLNKAYFLRENDPVFNGYVMRITGDTVVFQETVQDKLGKPLTREVTKKIFTPAV
jgi:Tfp pilus assembly protein PilP